MPQVCLGISPLRFCNLSITYGSHWLPIQRLHLVLRLTPLIGMLSDLQWYYATVIRAADPFVVWDLLRQFVDVLVQQPAFQPSDKHHFGFFFPATLQTKTQLLKKSYLFSIKKVTCKIFSQKTKLNANFFPETKVIIQKQKVICNN